MKKLISGIFFLSICAFSFGQSVMDEIEVLRDIQAAERRAVVAENLMLSEAEAKVFWPLYDEYRTEARKIGTKDIEMLKKFAENYENMTDEVASSIMNDWFKLSNEQLKLKSSYRTKMAKVLPATLVLRYFQIENKMDVIIDFGLAQEIPLTLKK